MFDETIRGKVNEALAHFVGALSSLFTLAFIFIIFTFLDVKCSVGVHSYHNYTSGSGPTNPSNPAAMRNILSFVVRF